MTVQLDALYDVQVHFAQQILDVIKDNLQRDSRNTAGSICIMTLVIIISPIVILFIRLIINDIQRYAVVLSDQTKALDQEQKRADSLLYRLLPKSVAQKLKHNEQVCFLPIIIQHVQ